VWECGSVGVCNSDGQAEQDGPESMPVVPDVILVRYDNSSD
jgi:hypothetical protein